MRVAGARALPLRGARRRPHVHAAVRPRARRARLRCRQRDRAAPGPSRRLAGRGANTLYSTDAYIILAKIGLVADPSPGDAASEGERAARVPRLVARAGKVRELLPADSCNGLDDARARAQLVPALVEAAYLGGGDDDDADDEDDE